VVGRYTLTPQFYRTRDITAITASRDDDAPIQRRARTQNEDRTSCPPDP
jgi:hypothetical protein